jgi:dnd system-associated protein 4
MSTLRRIQRDSTHEEFIKSLTTGDKAVFREIWRLLLLAATIGVREGIRTPLKSVDSGKAMPEAYFNVPSWRGIIYLISIAETGDSSCLHASQENQDQLVTAFEEYANSGLKILKDKLSSSSNTLDELTSFVLEVSADKLQDAEIGDLI